MKRLIGLSLATFLLSGLSQACDSPLLNHTDAATAQTPAVIAHTRSANCPLAFPANGLCASVTWENPPTTSQESPFQIRFWQADKGTENGPYFAPTDTVAAKLWMPSMGHGSSPIRVMPARDSSGSAVDGIFEASRVYFIMPGNWEVHVQLLHQNNVTEEAILPIHVQ